MMARSTPTFAILIFVKLFCLAAGSWTKLVGTLVEVCDTVGAREPVRRMIEVLGVTIVVDSAVGAAVLIRPVERELVESVAVENTEVLAAADRPDISIAENGDRLQAAESHSCFGTQGGYRAPDTPSPA